MEAFRQEAVAAGVLAVVAVVLAAGCASDQQLASLDSGASWCDSQYREYRDAAPTPAGMSKDDRSRYEDMTRDYHVSAACQDEARRTVRGTLPGVPRLPRGADTHGP